MGPGIIAMVGDNDAGGVATYAQSGQNYGYSLLWVLLLISLLIVNQEMVVRLGAVTGVGHARLINERFGRFWGWFSVGELFLLNFLTILTEFIGVALALAGPRSRLGLRPGDGGAWGRGRIPGETGAGTSSPAGAAQQATSLLARRRGQLAL